MTARATIRNGLAMGNSYRFWCCPLEDIAPIFVKPKVMDQMAGFNTVGAHIRESTFVRCYTKAEWDEYKNKIMPPAKPRCTTNQNYKL